MTPTPRLFARTPRAGRYNHVLLVPPGCPVPEDLDRCFRLVASGQAKGPNYLGASRRVTQAEGREGDEIIVIHGVDTEALTPEKRREYDHLLETVLGEVGRIVTSRIDWESNGPGPVAVPELANRLAGPALPRTSKPSGMAGWAWLVTAACMLLCAVVVAAMWTRQGAAPKTGKQPSPKPEDAASRLAKVWKRNTADVEKELKIVLARTPKLKTMAELNKSITKQLDNNRLVVYACPDEMDENRFTEFGKRFGNDSAASLLRKMEQPLRKLIRNAKLLKGARLEGVFKLNKASVDAATGLINSLAGEELDPNLPERSRDGDKDLPVVVDGADCVFAKHAVAVVAGEGHADLVEPLKPSKGAEEVVEFFGRYLKHLPEESEAQGKEFSAAFKTFLELSQRGATIPAR